MYNPEVPCIVDIYKKYLGDISYGTFVEIGAYDGDTHSCTAMLADNGWCGVYVEPIPKFAEMCRNRHKNNNVIVLTVAAGTGIGTIELNVAEQLTTSNSDFKRACDEMQPCEFRNYYDNVEKFSFVSLQLSLNDILNITGMPFEFDVLLLDTEQTEYQILVGSHLEEWRPKIVIIEMYEESPAWLRHEFVTKKIEDITKYMYERGYVKEYKDQTNTVFVKGNIYENINNR
jgi:FkbM family methyltransferase